MKKDITNEELNKYRSETPGCAQLIHFNNAGSSLPPDAVVDTIISYLREEAQYGGYETERKYLAQIENVYEMIAALINAEKDEVSIFENASAAWGTAFKGLDLKPGDEIITSELEFASNLINIIDLRKAGIKVTVINNDAQGKFPLDKLELAINAQTKLIAITHISSSGGGMLPIEAVGRIANRKGITYLVDACQSAGQFPLDVKAIGCDILSATGRKYLRAPRGTGFLFVRRSVQDSITPLLLDQHAARNITLQGYELRADARRFELYEKNRALILGLGKAVEYVLDIGVDRVWKRIKYLAALMRSELRKIPGINVHDVGDEQCGIVTFSANGFDNATLCNALAERGINVSFGSAANTLIYMSNRHLSSLVRASVHYYNTVDELVALSVALQDILQPETKSVKK